MHKRCFDTKQCQQWFVKMFFLLCICWLLWYQGRDDNIAEKVVVVCSNGTRHRVRNCT